MGTNYQRKSPSGVRLNKRQTHTCLSAIDTTKVIKRLQKHMVGEIEMTSTQIRAAEILLKKTIPDLKGVELSGDPENPVNMGITVEFVESSVSE